MINNLSLYKILQNYFLLLLQAQFQYRSKYVFLQNEILRYVMDYETKYFQARLITNWV